MRGAGVTSQRGRGELRGGIKLHVRGVRGRGEGYHISMLCKHIRLRSSTNALTGGVSYYGGISNSRLCKHPVDDVIGSQSEAVVEVSGVAPANQRPPCMFVHVYSSWKR